MFAFSSSEPNVIRHIPLGIIAAISMALCGGLGTTAFASCGDHLQHSASDSANRSLSLVYFEGAAQAPAPCNGPMCRRAPQTPTRSIPLAVERFSFERLTLPAEIEIAGAELPVFGHSDDPAIPTEDHRLGLDRPPRS